MEQENRPLKLVAITEKVPLDESAAAVASPYWRWAFGAVLVGCLALVIAAIPSFSFGSAAGGESGAVEWQYQSPYALFAARSPGLRGEVTTQSKPYYRPRVASNTRVPAAVPQERVLSPLRERPIDFGPDAPLSLNLDPADLDGVPFALLDPTLGAFVPGPDPSVGFPILYDPPPGETDPPVDVDNPPAVPEPATWVAMMIGLFFAGWRLRAADRNARKDATA
jgi:hypothetical protein